MPEKQWEYALRSLHGNSSTDSIAVPQRAEGMLPELVAALEEASHLSSVESGTVRGNHKQNNSHSDLGIWRATAHGRNQWLYPVLSVK